MKIKNILFLILAAFLYIKIFNKEEEVKKKAEDLFENIFERLLYGVEEGVRTYKNKEREIKSSLR